MSTWVIEAPGTTWEKAEPYLKTLSDQETVSHLEKLWAGHLNGHRLISNRSTWRRFPMIQNKNWFYKNIVLIGDALHTAHFSIGSGTKLAMEDSIALFERFTATESVAAALGDFESTR